MNKLLKFFIGESWINPRVICAVNASITIYYLYYTTYIDDLGFRPSRTPFPFLVLSVLVGHFAAIYLIEHHENKWQLAVGYFMPCAFVVVFIISIILDIIYS